MTLSQQPRSLLSIMGSLFPAAGNSGPSSSTVSNAAPWIMTVAASYIDRSFPTIVKLGNRQTFEGSSLYSGNWTKQLPLVYARTAGNNPGAQFCMAGSLAPKLVKKKKVCSLKVENKLRDEGKGRGS